ncbi:MAG: fumarylacetoacetate hydrolase family protein [Bacteroidota bacterium]
MNNKELAKKLDHAFQNVAAIPQISTIKPITEQDGYDIQKESMQKRYLRGEKMLGVHLGFTSEEKRKKLGVDQIILGQLTSSMLIQKGGVVLLEHFLRPRVQPELCFLVKKEISEEIKLEEIKEYIIGVAPALQITDSRYQGFKFHLPDVIADNCFSAGFAIGNWSDLETPIENLTIKLQDGAETLLSGSSKTILGNPYQAVVEAAKLCQVLGLKLKRGSYILAGAATASVELQKEQHIKVEVEQLGHTSFVTR